MDIVQKGSWRLADNNIFAFYIQLCLVVINVNMSFMKLIEHINPSKSCQEHFFYLILLSKFCKFGIKKYISLRKKIWFFWLTTFVSDSWPRVQFLSIVFCSASFYGQNEGLSTTHFMKKMYCNIKEILSAVYRQFPENKFPR